VPCAQERSTERERRSRCVRTESEPAEIGRRPFEMRGARIRVPSGREDDAAAPADQPV
jgi:hypothetical protein